MGTMRNDGCVLRVPQGKRTFLFTSKINIRNYGILPGIEHQSQTPGGNIQLSRLQVHIQLFTKFAVA